VSGAAGSGNRTNHGSRGKLAKLVCPACKREFEDYRAGGRKIYCSTACAAMGRRRGVEFVCGLEGCDVVFNLPPSRQTSKSGDYYCSREHYLRARHASYDEDALQLIDWDLIRKATQP
jgi:hypothetical protein